MVMYLSFIILFILGSFSFSMKRKHLLLMLLSLEFMVLSLFMGLFFYFNLLMYEYYFSLIFLTFSVCEGALGLSLLVSMIRSHGNDYFQTFNILW
nr:NADH dehydrogenase subunit 4L [Callimerus inbasalis]